jgi:two-component system response regulator
MDYDDVDILLVEDNALDAEMTTLALTDSGLLNKLFWVKDGEEALEFMSCTGAYVKRDLRHIPKLILLDLKMPRLSGLEVLRALKADERTKAIPVVVMTSSNEDSDIAESYALGVNAYVVKPVDFADFTSAVSNLGMFWLMLNQAP